VFVLRERRKTDEQKSHLLCDALFRLRIFTAGMVTLEPRTGAAAGKLLADRVGFYRHRRFLEEPCF